MIFSGNTTALGASTIPMAEGYDCSYGTSLALVEAARNDLAVFQALVKADYQEMAICKESTGVVQEGEISALHEAVGGGIFKKIAELFRKLVAKVKAIFHNFMAKINGLVMKDKDLVKKYQSELGRKRNLDKLEIKWRKLAKDFSTAEVFKIEDFDGAAKWNDGDDTWDRVKKYLAKDVDSVDAYVKEAIDDVLEDEDTVTLGSIGGWRTLSNVLSSNAKALKDMQTSINKETTRLEKLVKEYDKKANDAVKASVADKDDTTKANAVTDANKEYDMAQAYQTASLAKLQALQKAYTIYYKQCKAAFMKAVAANEKKLEESAYLDAVAEAAEQEVEDVITSALSDEELSDFTVASKDVKDADVSDDPDKLTYGPDCYTDHPEVWDGKDGSVDTTVGGGKVEESAYFGELLW